MTTALSILAIAAAVVACVVGSFIVFLACLLAYMIITTPRDERRADKQEWKDWLEEKQEWMDL